MISLCHSVAFITLIDVFINNFLLIEYNKVFIANWNVDKLNGLRVEGEETTD